MTSKIVPSGSVAHRLSVMSLLVTLGIVYGDIGTSPLYVMRAIVGATPVVTDDYIIGAVSCIIWTLTIQTTLKYVVLALRADNNGEGGILALYALVRKHGRRCSISLPSSGRARSLPMESSHPPLLFCQP